MQVLGFVVRVTHHSPEGQETLPICVTVYAYLSILMWSDSLVDEVLVIDAGFGKMISPGMTVG
jgi:hypothetical protein